MDFLAIFKVFELDAAAADGGTILESGQAPSPHAQGWNKPQGETPCSDFVPGCDGRGAWPDSRIVPSSGVSPGPTTSKNNQKTVGGHEAQFSVNTNAYFLKIQDLLLKYPTLLSKTVGGHEAQFSVNTNAYLLK